MMLKTKQMRHIFQPIEKQIIKLSELPSIEHSLENVDQIKKCILDQLYALLEKLDHVTDSTGYDKLKINITSIMEEFCTINQNVTDHHYNLFKYLIDKFSQALGEVEKFETQPLKQRLTECIKYIQDMGAAQEIEDLQNIKELGISIADIVEMLQPWQQNLVSLVLSERLGLYCCQLYASFSLLVSVVKEQYRACAPIYMAKKYVCDRICWCLESIIDTLDAPQPSNEEESHEVENHFVFRLDTVLDMIEELTEKSQKEQACRELWLAIEDVFTHAMSIAQICHQNSFKAITGTCQTVLTEYENLMLQLQSDPPDQSMNDLFINTLTDALYRLEQKINISVLTLVMEVFGDPFVSLKKLIQACGTTLKDRKKQDLSSAIEEFDQIVDKSVQIGKFAIACCRDKTKNAKIRNCLASFESLETELIPAITTFYLHPTNQEMQLCVKLLTSQWQVEMKDFQRSINLIIDPTAYCQIVFDDLQARIDELSNCLDDHRDITQSQVKIIIQRAITLSKQIDATVEDLGPENLDKHTIMTIREFKAAIYESDAALKKFLSRKATPPEQLRVIKRCEIMLKVIKRLPSVLTVIIDNSHPSNICRKQSSDSNIELSTHEPTFGEKSATFIKTPYSVKTSKQPLTIQLPNSITRNESDVSILMPYIRKGQLLRNEWSVMYKTPNKSKPENQQYQSMVGSMSSLRQHLFSRDSIVNSTDSDLFSFDFTSMLAEISQLSDTFS